MDCKWTSTAILVLWGFQSGVLASVAKMDSLLDHSINAWPPDITPGESLGVLELGGADHPASPEGKFLLAGDIYHESLLFFTIPLSTNIGHQESIFSCHLDLDTVAPLPVVSVTCRTF